MTERRYRLGPRIVCILSICILIAACNGHWGIGDTKNTLKHVAPADWTVRPAKNTALPTMLSYPSPYTALDSTLVIYIEGDGHAWRRKNIPSKDPTPRHPIGLRLADSTPGNFDVAYVARPCQFDSLENYLCEQSVWTSHRYADANVESIGSAIDEIRASADQEILLVGYSGGGVIAALLAASRDDISAFITVAANIDTTFWTSLHGVTPLSDSKNPSDLSDRLTQIPQVHFVGGRDKVVPPSVQESYSQSVYPSASNHVIILEEYDHHCCWVSNWPQLFSTALDTLDLPQTDNREN